ncbi:hypothetical protein ACSX1A_16360 [Pontibacter sp. MBLB2868]|uniref:hypothetical protein n=1 Tax=Pontibacter sp. MBLB2868 TaxID=3451555 RepID=UPI003F74C4DE
MKSQIEEMADTLNMSLAQYVAVLVAVGQNGEEGLKVLKNRLTAANEKQQETERELEKLLPFTKPAFAKPLAALLQNEQILSDLYTQYGKKSFERMELAKLGFQFNLMLQAKSIDKILYYFMGSYGWTYADGERKTITIREEK